jgi:hypothetical protein
MSTHSGGYAGYVITPFRHMLARPTDRQGRDTVFQRIANLGPFTRWAAGEYAALDIATAVLDVVR